MLKRLKIKFIAVIMSIVTVLFIVIFGLLLHLTKQNIERESVQMMRTMAFRPPASAPMHKPDNIPDNIRLPFFTVNISESGEITAFGSDYFDLTDKDMLRKLVDKADETSKETGVLTDYNLRYFKSYSEFRKAIVFADVSSEKAMIKGLVRNSVIIGLIGYVIFFLISLLLAKWVTKPV